MADAALRIAIDGRELTGRTTGVGRYLIEILRCWRSHPRHHFTIVAATERPAALDHLGERFTWTVAASPSAGTWWEQWHLPRVLRQIRPDVLFSPAYTAPLLSPCPVVQTVHDVSFFAHPEWFGGREGRRRRWITRATARRASAVVTVSEFSRNEIVRYLDIPADRVIVAPNGPPEAEDRLRESISAPEIDSRSRSSAPLVLFVGSLFNRRRIPDMIEAFADVARDVPGARFVLIGDNRTSPHLDPRQLAASAGVADRVEWLDYADAQVLDRMYGSARVFLFLSDYEGFALTPLEAIAHGVPPVLLDTAVSREIYAGAARFVPPNRAAIAGALKELLTDDHAHAALVQSSRAALTRFSWQQSADLVLAAIERAAR